MELRIQLHKLRMMLAVDFEFVVLVLPTPDGSCVGSSLHSHQQRLYRNVPKNKPHLWLPVNRIAPVYLASQWLVVRAFLDAEVEGADAWMGKRPAKTRLLVAAAKMPSDIGSGACAAWVQSTDYYGTPLQIRDWHLTRSGSHCHGLQRQRAGRRGSHLSRASRVPGIGQASPGFNGPSGRHEGQLAQKIICPEFAFIPEQHAGPQEDAKKKEEKKEKKKVSDNRKAKGSITTVHANDGILEYPRVAYC